MSPGERGQGGKSGARGRTVPRDTHAGGRPLRQAGGCDGAPRHDCRTILTFIARMSQMAGDACARVLLSARMNRCRAWRGIRV